jgi:superfamily II DNA/RNA helicase
VYGGDKFDENLVNRFSPKSQNYQIGLGEKEIDVLIASDVLSVGQNLQDSRVVVNFDLHWNPMNMEQRIGRIDRITTEHDELLIYNFIPTKELEASLGILDRIRGKIRDISSTLGHEAPILEDTEELVDKNMIIYDKLEDGEFSEEDGLSSVASKYDQFRNTVRKFCEENHIDIEELQQTSRIADKNRIAFQEEEMAKEDSFLGLTDLNYSSNRKDTRALVIKNEMSNSQIEIGGQKAFFDIPKIEDDELEIFNLIRSTEKEKRIGDIEDVREVQEVLESPSNWNQELLELESTLSDEINKIKQYCQTAVSDDQFSEEAQQKAEEITEMIQSYEIREYYQNELYNTFRKRNRLGEEKVINILYSKLEGFELSKPEKVDKVELKLTESLDS